MIDARSVPITVQRSNNNCHYDVQCLTHNEMFAVFRSTTRLGCSKSAGLTEVCVVLWCNFVLSCKQGHSCFLDLSNSCVASCLFPRCLLCFAYSPVDRRQLSVFLMPIHVYAAYGADALSHDSMNNLLDYKSIHFVRIRKAFFMPTIRAQLRIVEMLSCFVRYEV